MQHLADWLLHRHVQWRHLKFSELSELYVSMMLKTMALSMIGIFVPVYLYQLGYGLESIAVYYVIYFAVRVPLDFVFASMVAKWGPKHVIRYSYVILIVHMAMLLSLETVNWPLWFLAVLQSVSIGMFWSGYHVDFANIRREDSVGKQLSVMYTMVKIAAALGPFVGGLIANFYGIEFTMGLSIIIIALAMGSLMLSGEPAKTGIQVKWHKFRPSKYLKSYLAYSGLGFDQTVAMAIWPLYISVFIIFSDVYLNVGIVTSIGSFSAIILAKFFGDVVDNKKGGKLLNYSVPFMSIANLFRALSSTILQVVGINIFYEGISNGVKIPFTKGFYSEAQDSNELIPYIAFMEASVNIARATIWSILLVGLMLFKNDQQAFHYIFIVAAAGSLLIYSRKFKALA